MNHAVLDPHKVKIFMKHICFVNRRYLEREIAQKSVEEHIELIRDKSSLDDEVFELNRKINVLLEKEARVAELGLHKRLPNDVKEKILYLERQLRIIQAERDKLSQQNEELKKAFLTVSDFKNQISEANETKINTEQTVRELEKNIDNKYREFLLEEMENKIKFLEASIKRIAKNKDISQERIFNLKEKIAGYKQRLKELKS